MDPKPKVIDLISAGFLLSMVFFLSGIIGFSVSLVTRLLLSIVCFSVSLIIGFLFSLIIGFSASFAGIISFGVMLWGMKEEIVSQFHYFHFSEISILAKGLSHFFILLLLFLFLVLIRNKRFQDRNHCYETCQDWMDLLFWSKRKNIHKSRCGLSEKNFF